MLFYRILSILSFPIVEIWTFWRIFKGKDDRVRFKEKFGIASKKRPEGDLIWIHGVSVGEINSALTLVNEILAQDPKVTILLTSTTLTSAQIVADNAEKYQGRLIHQFCVLDLFYQVKRFFDYWQPKKIIFLESEIWPNIIDEAKRNKIPLYLVNARISQQSLKNWSYFKYLLPGLFDKFDKIIAQSVDDKARFEKLTKKRISFLGNLKAQFRKIEYDEAQYQSLLTKIGDRPVFLAASTHRGEEEVIIDCHLKLKKDFNNILTILVIRHPNRALEVEKLLGNISYAKRSRKEEVKNDKELYLVDTIGELGLFYKLSDFAFIGGSLQEIGGHNPLEAVMLDCAVISGKHVFNFRQVYQDLAKSNSCIMIENGLELYENCHEFIKNPQKAQNLAKAAKNNFDLSKDVSRNIVDMIL